MEFVLNDFFVLLFGWATKECSVHSSHNMEFSILSPPSLRQIKLTTFLQTQAKPSGGALASLQPPGVVVLVSGGE